MTVHTDSLAFECQRIQEELCKVDARTLMAMQECYCQRVNTAIVNRHINEVDGDHYKNLVHSIPK